MTYNGMRYHLLHHSPSNKSHRRMQCGLCLRILIGEKRYRNHLKKIHCMAVTEVREGGSEGVREGGREGGRKEERKRRGRERERE